MRKTIAICNVEKHEKKSCSMMQVELLASLALRKKFNATRANIALFPLRKGTNQHPK